MTSYCVVCEIAQGQITVFDFTKQQLTTLPNKSSAAIGGFYRVGRNGALTSVDPEVFVKESLEFSVKRSTTHIKTFVICPKSDTLSSSLKTEFSGKPWSPLLGFVRDPKGMLADSFEKGRRHEVFLKYSPAADTVFDVVDVTNFKTKRSGKQVQQSRTTMTTRAQTRAKKV
ncbi:hypothetical protein CAEBREN_15297 [Caenorhabditis brenneri]|uniref:DUF7038 domain-containing protein n=1 Tax=Caenorhabditis brenneri TaxID=135651 RepID=G0MMK5_CAEBE|nr:hypothetical protein CAEBREN_15297 [Caenorhabditis brenneri]